MLTDRMVDKDRNDAPLLHPISLGTRGPLYLLTHLSQLLCLDRLMVMHAIIYKDGEKHATIVVVDGAADDHVADGHALGLEAPGCARIDEQVWFEGLILLCGVRM